jgi:hypothetical protein
MECGNIAKSASYRHLWQEAGTQRGGAMVSYPTEENRYKAKEGFSLLLSSFTEVQ